MLALEKILKALADRNRLRILKLLEHKSLCVCELAFVLDITQPSVSRHLKKLSAAGLIGAEQESFWTNYFLQSNNPYGQALLANLERWLNDDPVIVADRQRSLKADRAKLCKK